MPARSAPELNARPSPVKTTKRVEKSVFSSRQRAISSPISFASNAFSRSGRLSRTIRVSPRLSSFSVS
jgi:hypothetical protein